MSTQTGAALEGVAIKYGKDNIDTDQIMPGRYCHLTEDKDIQPHTLEDLDDGFVDRVKPGDILVAGTNFGCGSSREVAPLGIKLCGVALVIAPSFARIFYRNAINIGLPILECPEAYQGIRDGDRLRVDLAQGLIEDLDTGGRWTAAPFPEFVQGIMRAGGLMAYVQQQAFTEEGR